MPTSLIRAEDSKTLPSASIASQGQHEIYKYLTTKESSVNDMKESMINTWAAEKGKNK